MLASMFRVIGIRASHLMHCRRALSGAPIAKNVGLVPAASELAIPRGIKFEDIQARREAVEMANINWTQTHIRKTATMVERTDNKVQAMLGAASVLEQLIENYVSCSQPEGKLADLLSLSLHSTLYRMDVAFSPVFPHCRDYFRTHGIFDIKDNDRICFLLQTYFHRALKEGGWRLWSVEENVRRTMLAVVDQNCVQGRTLVLVCVVGMRMAFYELDAITKECFVYVDGRRARIPSGRGPTPEQWNLHVLSPEGKDRLLHFVDRQLFAEKL